MRTAERDVDDEVERLVAEIELDAFGDHLVSTIVAVTESTVFTASPGVDLTARGDGGGVPTAGGDFRHADSTERLHHARDVRRRGRARAELAVHPVPVRQHLTIFRAQQEMKTPRRDLRDDSSLAPANELRRRARLLLLQRLAPLPHPSVLAQRERRHPPARHLNHPLRPLRKRHPSHRRHDVSRRRPVSIRRVALVPAGARPIRRVRSRLMVLVPSPSIHPLIARAHPVPSTRRNRRRPRRARRLRASRRRHEELVALLHRQRRRAV